jgi:transcriptional antiterminator NusG
VIQVLAGKEEKIITSINQSDIVNAFIPKRTKVLRQKGQVLKIHEILFPGYVFVETDADYNDFIHHLNHHIKPILGFIRLLEHDHVGTQSLYPQERSFIESFTNSQHIIGTSTGFIEGDKIIITEGPLVGHESQIRRIDRHKRIAELDVSMFGQIRKIKVSCEILSKTNEK